MEELDIPAALRRLEPYRLSRIERVIVAHGGTVQLLLSLYFGAPVGVKLLQQSEMRGEIHRDVSLVLTSSGEEVCFARSIIPLASNDPAILDDVRQGKLGLGQIAVKHRILSERWVTRITATSLHLSRKYVITGSGLRFVVTEDFPRRLYR